jgi:hypothetical protein
MDTKKSAGEPSSRAACWPDDRAEELKALRQLLATVSGLNHGSGFLESVRWCITTAERLQTGRDLHLSFINHLERDCITEREANKS